MVAGKVAIVTGAGSGIGEACSRMLAARGARVVVNDVNAEAAERVVAAIGEEGGTAMAVLADVADPAGCESLVEQAVGAYGGLHIAVNNAGIGGPPAPTGEYPLDGWRSVMNVNLDGVFYCMRYEIPAMLSSGGGSIVNMSSILGSVAFATAPAYVAAKHGVVGLSRTAAVEYAAAGIRVNAVGPGFIDTPLLQNPPNRSRNTPIGDSVIKAGLEFTPVEEVAQVAWNAVHGDKVHVLVGKTARKMGFIGKWFPGKLRQRAKTLAQAHEKSEGRPANA